MFKLLNELNIDEKLKLKNLALLPGFNIIESNYTNNNSPILNKKIISNNILDETLFNKLLKTVDENNYINNKKFTKKRQMDKKRASRKKK